MTDKTALERMTVNLIPKAAEALGTAAAREGLSKTDTVNRALQLYDYVTGLTAAGAEVLIRTPGSAELTSLKLL
ncbi:MAG: hypothetical protein M3Y33_03870 [Actinomycetota bacterium]|nr:hypothetical protein [Actinomycetota bacterium]